MARTPQDEKKLHEAMVALKQHNPFGAITKCRELIARLPRDWEVLYALGMSLDALGTPDEAIQMLQKSVRINPRVAAVHIASGHVQIRRAKYDKAISHFEKARKLAPDSREPAAGIAHALSFMSEHAKALEYLQPFLDEGAETAHQTRIAADCLHRLGRNDEAIALLRRHIASAELPAQRGHLGLLLAKIQERLGDYDASFEAAKAANDAFDDPYDPDEDTAEFQEIMDIFSRERLPKLPRATHGIDAPVFVIGMPRTGSTLVERIIDAHPRAHGAGETQIMGVLTRDLSLTSHSNMPYPRCGLTLRPIDVERLGREYLELAHRRHRKAPRIVDKLLTNYRELGLISLMLPDAHVIDARRDAVNTCLSCYMSPLSRMFHPWACRLEHLAHRYRLYEQLMNYWHEVLDLKILTVPYESLVEDQEGWSRKIIDFIGLEWDDRCLAFYKSAANVSTISRDQVNKPIYRGSLSRADRFGAHLDPLRAALAAES